MNCPECHKHRDYKLCKVCNLCTNCCDCEETPLERWSEVRWSQFSKLIMAESKCLEEAKEACLKEIERAKENIDDTV